MARLSESGVPFIHLLNIKDLASHFGLPISPGTVIAPATDLYVKNYVNPLGPVLALALLLSLLIAKKMRDYRSHRVDFAQSTATPVLKEHVLSKNPNVLTDRYNPPGRT